MEFDTSNSWLEHMMYNEFGDRFMFFHRWNEGGRDHISHNLVRLGMTDRKVVILLYIVSLIGGVIALMLSFYNSQGLTLFAIYVLIATALGIYLSLKAQND